ncbi:hypothetical protein CLIB1444_03S04632 [[Candida] jaroonii]|uniref:Uncharacterized protein n=1 Tax=[Candida] jaroonii TaxID=467808 RepID=A0ACA9Y633_9ASCO|nr:hypothetical protein CLIB1444_03S04632 [[Candida] jaroonii]
MSRPVLTSRDSNIISPIKSKSRSSSASPLKDSPSKRIRYNGSPIRSHKKSSSLSTASPNKLQFKIFEDPIVSNTVDHFNDLEVDGKENLQTKDSKSQTNDFNEQENILQPKLKHLPQTNNTFRSPLSNLSINEYPGFINFDNFSKPQQLNEPFIPKNFKNESNSIHKFYNNYPSYISPMKSNNKFLFKSVESNEFNEDDALEQDLFKKSVLIRRKRSLSLGKNDLKLSLIKKNDFTILSN